MNSKAKICALVPSLLAFSLLAGAANNHGWSLVWSDEFNQPDGSSPDPTKWVFELGNNNGWGNSELEYYTSRTNNARISGGMLVIEADEENYLGSSYTSARMKTQGKWSWQFGRMEARIKIPRGQGMWPAFWMLGTNITSVNWPACGEVDIMENIGREPTLVHGTVHGPGYSGANGIGGPCALPGNPTFADDFHVYAVEWTTNEVKWFVDGFQYFSVNPARLPGGTTWVYTQPQFILLNLAVGGGWPGNPDGTTTFPQQMLVDYVRVYAPTNLPENPTNLLGNAGFESANLANWTVYGAGFNTVQENITNVDVHNGTNVFKVFGQFNGLANSSGIYQDIPATAGQALAAHGWMFTAAGDQIAGGNSAWIDVSFRDASANVLALYRSASVTTNTPPGLWLDFPVTNQLNPASFTVVGSVTNLVAPANTSFVRCQAVFEQPATAAGSVYFDDLKLAAATTGIPVPASIVHAGSNLSLMFGTYLNLPYQINWSDLLAAPSWSVLTNLSGSGTSQTVTLNLQASSRFFRVSRLCN
jgi:beta-glucanase (GH16 family)